jgi:hypothetical protein
MYANLATTSTELVTALLSLNNEFNGNGQLSNLTTGMAERVLNMVGIDIRDIAKCVSELEVSLNPVKILVARSGLKGSLDVNVNFKRPKHRKNKLARKKIVKQKVVENVEIAITHFKRENVPYVNVTNFDDNDFFDAQESLNERSTTIIDVELHDQERVEDHVTLSALYDLIERVDNDKLHKCYWMYWQPNSDVHQNNIVHRCQQSIIKNIDDWQLIVLNADNEQEFVPSELMTLKRNLSVQCWSDVIRMWLLLANGGVWIDASVFMTNSFPAPHKWLVTHDAMFFLEKIEDNLPILENWVIACRPNLDYIKTWMKCFITVVFHDNKITNALPDLNLLTKVKGSNIDVEETYLTMHQMSKLAQNITPLPRSMILPGFTGPLGWIQPGMEMYDWMHRIIDGSYKPQAGMVKLINIARTVTSNWEEASKLTLTIPDVNLDKHLDFLIISVGTGGDILSGEGIKQQLLHKTNNIRHITVSNSIDNTNADHLRIDVDFLELSKIELTNLGANLGFVKELFTQLTRKLNGVTAKYMVANYHVPCMMQMARLTGSVPINFTAIPLFSEASGYTTMNKNFEIKMTETVNSMTKSIAADENLPWNYDGVHKGKSQILTWFNCNDALIKPSRNTVITRQVGSVVDSDAFATDMDLIITQQLGNKGLIDIVLPGPSLSALNNSKFKTSLRHMTGKSNTLIIISSQLKNLSRKMNSKIINNCKEYYREVKVINNMNILKLNGIVKIAYCHGGQNTINDLISMNCQISCFGEFVDQPYWSTAHNFGKPEPRHSLSDVINETLLLPIPDVEGKTVKQLMHNNEMYQNKFEITRMQSHINIMYDPVTTEHCVKLCFQQWAKIYEHHIYLDLDDWCRPLMQEHEIIVLACKLQVNLSLTTSALTKVYNFNDDFKTINLNIETQGTLHHAKLCHIVNSSHSSPMPNLRNTPLLHNKPKPLLIGQNNTQTQSLQALCEQWKTTTLLNMQPLGDRIAHTLSSLNLDARMQRVANPLSLAILQTRSKHVSMLETGRPPLRKLLAILHSGGWTLGIAVQAPDNSIYLITEDIIQHSTIMIADLGCNILTNNASEGRSDIIEKFRPLNQRTLQRLDSTTVDWEYSRKLANQNSTHVVVYDFDNRGHDKYDERTIIKSATVLWLGQDINDAVQEKLDQTYGKTLRLIYHRGHWKWKFDTNNYGEIWLMRALCAERQFNWTGTHNMVVHAWLDEEDERSLTGYLNKVRDPTLVDHAIVTKTKKEWMSTLGIWGSAFETFSNKICTQHENDTFSCKIELTVPSVPDRGNWDALTAEGIVMVNKRTMYSAYQRLWLVPCGKGGNAFAEEEKISLGNSNDWWKKMGQNDVILKDLEPNPLTDTFVAMGQTMANEWTNRATMNYAEGEPRNDEELDFTINVTNKSEVYEDIVPHTIQNMWINTDLSMDLRQYAPLNVANIRTKENPDKIRDLLKVSLNQPTPMESRPVLTKWFFEEHRSITGRLFSKLIYRKSNKTVNVKRRLKDFISVYFDDNFSPYTESSQLLDIDQFETMRWISKRKDGLKIAQELNELFTTELGVIPLNAINIHLKLESLLKEEPFMHWGQHQARAIYWQRKAIAAISSPVFLKVKTRLKNSLKSKFVYADGLTPDELNQKSRNTQGINWFFENDLSKQDRQTDKPIIDLEMELYELLGVTKSMIRWWRTMHENWKFKARWNKGYASEMRLTGQSTTSLGNLITNMQVHLEFIKTHYSTIKLVFMLGDDILVMLSDKPDVRNLGKHTKEAHNMKSTQRLSNVSGVFCCMIGYKNSNGSAEIGPDFLRLRYRFELTNGVSQANPENIEARCQSYACMLGKTPEMIHLKKERSWTIPLLDWYDNVGLTDAIADRYDVSEMDVINHYNKLVEYLADPQIIEHQFSIYTAAKVY